MIRAENALFAPYYSKQEAQQSGAIGFVGPIVGLPERSHTMKKLTHSHVTRRCRTWFFYPRKNKDRFGIKFRWRRGERVIPVVVIKCSLSAFAFFIAYLMAQNGMGGYGGIVIGAILIALFA